MAVSRSLKDSFTGAVINNPDGVPCRVVDPARLDFGSDEEAVYSKKSRPVKAWIAAKGEKIITALNQGVETSFVAEGGEVVFENELPGGLQDIYVPRDREGRSNGGEILARDYLPASGKLGEGVATFAPNMAPEKTLHEIVDEPVCLADTYGPGNHAFFYKGASFKSVNGRVTGIDKDAFDFTRSLTDRDGKILRPQGP